MSGLLGGVERQAGAADQVLGGRAILRRLGHADGGADLQRAASLNRLGKGRTQRRGQRLGEAGIAAAGDDGELVVLEAAEQRCLRQRGLEPLRNGAHRLVAARTPHRIVDLAEAVGVDQREGDMAARAPAPLDQRTLEALNDDALIGQPGQDVFAGQLAHGFDAARERARQPQRRPRRHHGKDHQRDADRAGDTPQPVHGADQRAIRRPGEPADDAAMRVLHRLHLAAAVRRRIRAEAQVGKSAALLDQPHRAVVETIGSAKNGAQVFERPMQSDLPLGGQPPVIRLCHRNTDHRAGDRRAGEQEQRERRDADGVKAFRGQRGRVGNVPIAENAGSRDVIRPARRPPSPGCRNGPHRTPLRTNAAGKVKAHH